MLNSFRSNLNCSKCCRVAFTLFAPEIKVGFGGRKRSAIGATMSCLKSVCELADAPPHHLGSKTYVIKRGDVIYGVQICKSELKVNGKRQMLCGLQTLRTPNFARALKWMEKNWTWINDYSSPAKRTQTEHEFNSSC